MVEKVAKVPEPPKEVEKVATPVQNDASSSTD